jgi:tetratricopeptide (TPR) repeat protein
VVTFYSYKGGTGRTMALANVAWLLAANGKRVLVVDWDLESPGLHRFFHPFMTSTELESSGGVVDLLSSFLRGLTDQSAKPDDWYVEFARVRPYAFTLHWDHFPQPDGRIDFMSAGHQDDTYAPSLAMIDWDRFYGAGGGLFLKALREDMKTHYDYTLIDSRTGVSDVADVCTTHLPDSLVACFTLNAQGIEGTHERVNAIRSPRRAIRVLPVPTRVETFEQDRLDTGRAVAMQRFNGLPAGMDEADRAQYWLDVEIPYRPLYAYEEMLATIGDVPGQPSSLSASYARLAGYLTHHDVEGLPPLDERLRLAARARFLRTVVVPPDPVILRYDAVDQVWAEWITDVLVGVNVDVYDDLAARSSAASEARELVIISGASWEKAERYPVEQTGSRPRLGVYIGDVKSVPAFPLRTSAQLHEQSEAVAVERLLRLVGYEGALRPATKLRYPGRPAEVFNVPVRNPNFTGREDDLRALRRNLLETKQAALLQTSAPVALHGWGGIGKTQVAIEYAHRFRNAYDAIWWIICDPASFIDSALADLAKELGIVPSASVPETNRAVLGALTRGEPYRRWLLIFDNASNYEQLRPFLPHVTGEVLITSRNANWPEDVESVAVDVFDRGESIDHLQRRVEGLSAADAAKVADALGDLPIAVSVAGAYLRETGYAVTQYLQQIEEQGPRALSAQSAVSAPDSATVGQPSQRAQPVEKTWDLLLERLQQRSRAASRLLQLCSVMAPEIALPLIYSDEMATMLKPYDPAVADRYLRGSLVQIMSQLALIKLDLASKRISVHRLLQHVIRQRMQQHEVNLARHQVHLVLSGSRPDQDVDDPDSWDRFRMLWSHLEVSGAASCPDEAVRALMIDRVRYVWLRGSLKQGEVLANEIISGWNRLLKEIDDDADRRVLRRQILHLQFNLANILRDQARFAEARRLNEQVLAAQEELLGASHPHTLMTANGLAGDLRALGLYRESLDRDLVTYDIWVEHFGEDYGRTLNALNNLAASYRLLGDYRAARKYDTLVYERQRAIPGNERSAIALRAAANLGRDLREAGEYQESVKLLRSAASEYAAVYGPDSRFALNATVNLAVSLRSAGHADEASSLLESAYERLNESSGPGSPDTLACRLSWSLNLLATGDAYRAQTELTAVHDAYEDSLGARHPHTLVCLANMSAIARADNDLPRAHSLAAQADEAIRAVLGPQHPYALAAAMNLAVAIAESGDPDRAAIRMLEVTAHLEEVLGPDHPDTLRGLANVALARRPRGGAVNGEQDLTERLSARLGREHPAVVAFGEYRYLHRVLDPHPF